MDIQTNVDMLTQADYKDWNYYDIEEKRQKLLSKLEKIRELEKDPHLIKEQNKKVGEVK